MISTGLRMTQGTFGPRERQLLREVCEAIDVPPELVAKLLDLRAEPNGNAPPVFDLYRRSIAFSGRNGVLWMS